MVDGVVERFAKCAALMELPSELVCCRDTDTLRSVAGRGATLSDYSPVGVVHLKDPYANYRGNTSTPTQEHTILSSVYHNLAASGVDFHAVLQGSGDKHTKAGYSSSLDGPRPGDDGFDAIGGNPRSRVEIIFAQRELSADLA